MVHPRPKITYHLGPHPWWGASGSHRLYATEWERNGTRLGESRSSETGSLEPNLCSPRLGNREQSTARFGQWPSVARWRSFLAAAAAAVVFFGVWPSSWCPGCLSLGSGACVLDCFCPTHTLRAWLHLLPDRGEASPFLGSAASKLEMSGRSKSFFFWRDVRVGASSSRSVLAEMVLVIEDGCYWAVKHFGFLSRPLFCFFGFFWVLPSPVLLLQRVVGLDF